MIETGKKGKLRVAEMSRKSRKQFSFAVEIRAVAFARSLINHLAAEISLSLSFMIW